MHRLFPSFVGGLGAFGVLLVRLAVGAAFLLHGWFKIQSTGGASGWMGPDAPVPGFMQALAAFSEFLGGIGLILGFLTPVASVFLAAVMGVAINLHAGQLGHPFVAANPKEGSWELAASYLASVLLLLLIGPGKLSLDYLLFTKKPLTRI